MRLIYEYWMNLISPPAGTIESEILYIQSKWPNSKIRIQVLADEQLNNSAQDGDTREPHQDAL